MANNGEPDDGLIRCVGIVSLCIIALACITAAMVNSKGASPLDPALSGAVGTIVGVIATLAAARKNGRD